MDAKEIRVWCLKHPRPKLLRVQSADDTTQEIKAPRSGQSWVTVSTTIAALQPVLIEAFEEDGSLIRAWRDGDGDDDDDDGDSKPRPLDVPSVLTSDPETARLTHFANLLFRSQQFATEVAFQKMAELFERMDSRSASIEARLERAEANYRRALQQQVDDAFDQAAGIAEAAQQSANGQPADPRQAMIEMFINNAVAGWMQRNHGGGGPPPPPPGKPNGKPGGSQ